MLAVQSSLDRCVRSAVVTGCAPRQSHSIVAPDQERRSRCR